MALSPSDRCAVPRCKNESVIIYLGKPVCERCWVKGCQDVRSSVLRKKLGLPQMKESIRVVKILLVGWSRKELKSMAKNLGVDWSRSWKKKDAKQALKLVMLRSL